MAFSRVFLCINFRSQVAIATSALYAWKATKPWICHALTIYAPDVIADLIFAAGGWTKAGFISCLLSGFLRFVLVMSNKISEEESERSRWVWPQCLCFRSSSQMALCGLQDPCPMRPIGESGVSVLPVFVSACFFQPCLLFLPVHTPEIDFFVNLSPVLNA